MSNSRTCPYPDPGIISETKLFPPRAKERQKMGSFLKRGPRRIFTEKTRDLSSKAEIFGRQRASERGRHVLGEQLPSGTEWPGTLGKQRGGQRAEAEGARGRATGRGSGRRRGLWGAQLGAEGGCSQAHAPIDANHSPALERAPTIAGGS